MKNICVFGDSISKGVIIDAMSDHYSTTKQSFVNLISGFEPWMHISNYAMFGCTINKGRTLIKRHFAEVENCDAVILEYGGNDCDFDWASIAASPDEQHLPKTPLEDFYNNYKEIIDGLEAIGKKIILLNLPPIDSNKYFDWFGNGLDKDNIKKWLGGDVHYIYEYHAGYNDKVCEIASEYKLPIIDIRSEFLRQPNYTDLLCRDGIHPNEQGHALIAQIIKDGIPQLYYNFTHSFPERLA